MDAIETAVRGEDLDLEHEAGPELAALRGCPQTPAFHAEGDVAVHTSWVYALAREQAVRRPGPAGVALRLAALDHVAERSAVHPRGPFPGPDELWRCWRAARDSATSEGFVVRTTAGFARAQFGTHVAKWVRPSHVRTDEHWMAGPMIPNGRAGPGENGEG